MFGRCNHYWEDEGHVFNPPYVRKIEVSGPSASMLFQKSLFGWTNITQRCTYCGKINVIEVAGRANIAQKPANVKGSNIND